MPPAFSSSTQMKIIPRASVRRDVLTIAARASRHFDNRSSRDAAARASRCKTSGMTRRIVSLIAVLFAGCSRSAPPTEAGRAPPSVAAPATAPPSASTVTSAPAEPAAHAAYPVGRECSTEAALRKEKKSLPPRDRWLPIASTKERLRLRVPDGVFQSKEGSDGLRLVSSLKARGLGPGSSDRYFALRLQRLGRSVDDLLADKTKDSPLAKAYPDEAFPKRTSRSFVASPDEPVRSGASMRTTVAGKPAYVWVTGAEGYNSDYVLVDLGSNETVLVVAEWNSAVMAGQPECYQRAVLGGVIDSIVVDP
jgi:hypothetical protein